MSGHTWQYKLAAEAGPTVWLKVREAKELIIDYRRQEGTSPFTGALRQNLNSFRFPKLKM